MAEISSLHFAARIATAVNEHPGQRVRRAWRRSRNGLPPRNSGHARVRRDFRFVPVDRAHADVVVTTSRLGRGMKRSAPGPGSRC
jgi:hypothetical protein